MLASQPSRTPRRGRRTVPQRVQEVLSRLQAAYGRPRNTDRRAPLDELTLTVRLNVERTGGHKPAALACHQRPGGPAALRPNDTGMLEGSEPVPFQKRGFPTYQGVPVLARYLAHSVQQLDLGHQTPSLAGWRRRHLDLS